MSAAALAPRRAQRKSCPAPEMPRVAEDGTARRPVERPVERRVNEIGAPLVGHANGNSRFTSVLD